MTRRVAFCLVIVPWAALTFPLLVATILRWLAVWMFTGEDPTSTVTPFDQFVLRAVEIPFRLVRP